MPQNREQSHAKNVMVHSMYIRGDGLFVDACHLPQMCEGIQAQEHLTGAWPAQCVKNNSDTNSPALTHSDKGYGQNVYWQFLYFYLLTGLFPRITIYNNSNEMLQIIGNMIIFIRKCEMLLNEQTIPHTLI